MNVGNLISDFMHIFHVVLQEVLRSDVFPTLRTVNFFGILFVFNYVHQRISLMVESSTKMLNTGCLHQLHEGQSYAIRYSILH